jgi:hypothetical protein
MFPECLFKLLFSHVIFSGIHDFELCQVHSPVDKSNQFQTVYSVAARFVLYTSGTGGL